MRSLRIFISSLFVICLASYVFALEKPTHEALNKKIASISGINSYLINQLGFAKGLNKSAVNNKLIIDWIKEGGIKEDEPMYTRSFNHFHDPLTTWDSAGLYGTFQSSVLWAQDQGLFGSLWGGNYSWSAVREYFYISLTGKDFNGGIIASTQTEREIYFGKTFQGIGQIMHLVEDASVPAHTRDDAHVIGYHYGKEDETKKELI